MRKKKKSNPREEKRSAERKKKTMESRAPKTGILSIRDTRQIIDDKINDTENNDKIVGNNPDK